MNKKKLNIILTASVLIAAGGIAAGSVLANRGEPAGDSTECTVEAPDQYKVGETTVQAFPVGEGIEVTLLPSDDPDETEPRETESTMDKADKETGKFPAIHIEAVYRYAGVSEVWERTNAYCNMLMREDFGFVPVNEENMKIDFPILGPADSVRLVKEIKSEDAPEFLFSLSMQWTSDELTVTVAKVDGKIQEPPKPKPEKPPKKEPLTVAQTMKIFSDCKPSELGLEGESMKDYRIIMLDGSVMVGEEACMRVNIYTNSEITHSNVIAGMYLLSATGEKMYRVDLNNSLQLVNFTKK